MVLLRFEPGHRHGGGHVDHRNLLQEIRRALDEPAAFERVRELVVQLPVVGQMGAAVLRPRQRPFQRIQPVGGRPPLPVQLESLGEVLLRRLEFGLFALKRLECRVVLAPGLGEVLGGVQVELPFTVGLRSPEPAQIVADDDLVALRHRLVGIDRRVQLVEPLRRVDPGALRLVHQLLVERGVVVEIAHRRLFLGGGRVVRHEGSGNALGADGHAFARSDIGRVLERRVGRRKGGRQIGERLSHRFHQIGETTGGYRVHTPLGTERLGRVAFPAGVVDQPLDAPAQRLDDTVQFLLRAFEGGSHRRQTADVPADPRFAHVLNTVPYTVPFTA